MSLSTLQQQVLAAMNIPTFEADNDTMLLDKAVADVFVVYADAPEAAEKSPLVQRVLAILGIEKAEFHALSCILKSQERGHIDANEGIMGWRMQGADTLLQGAELITPSLSELQGSAASKRALWQCLMSRCDGFVRNNSKLDSGVTQ